jgi:hypothetical protein
MPTDAVGRRGAGSDEHNGDASILASVGVDFTGFDDT